LGSYLCNYEITKKSHKCFSLLTIEMQFIKKHYYKKKIITIWLGAFELNDSLWEGSFLMVFNQSIFKEIVIYVGVTQHACICFKFLAFEEEIIKLS
jgi:hypothetical protein